MNPSLFFAVDGGCSPELTEGQKSDAGGQATDDFTDVAIEQAARNQALDIEEQLLKLRLQRRCERAIAVAQLLAVQSPKSKVHSPQSHFPASGSEHGSGEVINGPISGDAFPNPAVTHSPVSFSTVEGQESEQFEGSTESRPTLLNNDFSAGAGGLGSDSVSVFKPDSSSASSLKSLAVIKLHNERCNSNETLGPRASGPAVGHQADASNELAPFHHYPKGRWTL